MKVNWKDLLERQLQPKECLRPSQGPGRALAQGPGPKAKNGPGPWAPKSFREDFQKIFYLANLASTFQEISEDLQKVFSGASILTPSKCLISIVFIKGFEGAARKYMSF